MGVKVREWKGAWWVFVNHQGRRKAKRCATRKAAEMAADKIDAALKLGQLDGLWDAPAAPAVARTMPTFAEYTDRWMESVARMRLKPSSLEQYRVRLRLRLVPVLGPMPLDKITREVVRNLIGEIIRMGNFRVGRNRPEAATVAPARATVLEALRALSAILSTAEEDGLIATNPARRMGRNVADAGATEAREVEVFDRGELTRLLASAESDFPAFYPFVLTLARTGMRLGEALALEWRDIDWRNRLILVRRSRRRNRLSEPKNGKARRVDMSAQLVTVLRGLQALQEAEAVVEGREPSARLFNTPDGTPFHEDTFRRVWQAIIRRAGLRYRKPHTLRHTFASLLLEAGEPILYVQTQLGHHSPEFTLKVYGHQLPRGSRRAVDMLDDATGCNPGATEGATPTATP